MNVRSTSLLMLVIIVFPTYYIQTVLLQFRDVTTFLMQQRNFKILFENSQL